MLVRAVDVGAGQYRVIKIAGREPDDNQYVVCDAGNYQEGDSPHDIPRTSARAPLAK